MNVGSLALIPCQIIEISQKPKLLGNGEFNYLTIILTYSMSMLRYIQKTWKKILIFKLVIQRKYLNEKFS